MLKYLLLSIILLTGCTQKIYQYEEVDPEGRVLASCLIKVNSLASDSSADWIELRLPQNASLTVSKYVKLDDSLRLRFDPLSNTYEILTSK